MYTDLHFVTIIEYLAKFSVLVQGVFECKFRPRTSYLLGKKEVQ